MKLRSKSILGGLILAVGLIWGVVFQFPDHQLHLVFCDVGQGDATLIYQNQTQILIDGGPNNEVLNCLAKHVPFYDRRIEMVIETHPEADHLTGLLEVLSRFQIQYLVLNANGKETKLFDRFQKLVSEEKAVVIFPESGQKIQIGSLVLTNLWPPNQNQVLGATTMMNKINETSLVFGLKYGQFQALFLGDVDAKVEKLLDFTPVEVLKVAHHGSKTSTDESFLQKIRPELAVISVGINSYGHPTAEVLDRLATVGAKILRTDQAGDIEITSDGRYYFINK